MAVGQHQWYHFGVGAPPILVYFSWDWDVRWGVRGFEKPVATCFRGAAEAVQPGLVRRGGESAPRRLQPHAAGPGGWAPHGLQGPPCAAAFGQRPKGNARTSLHPPPTHQSAQKHPRQPAQMPFVTKGPNTLRNDGLRHGSVPCCRFFPCLVGSAHKNWRLLFDPPRLGTGNTAGGGLSCRQHAGCCSAMLGQHGSTRRCWLLCAIGGVPGFKSGRRGPHGTWSQVSFKNTLIILTSNCGAKEGMGKHGFHGNYPLSPGGGGGGSGGFHCLVFPKEDGGLTSWKTAQEIEKTLIGQGLGFDAGEDEPGVSMYQRLKTKARTPDSGRPPWRCHETLGVFNVNPGLLNPWLINRGFITFGGNTPPKKLLDLPLRGAAWHNASPAPHS